MASTAPLTSSVTSSLFTHERSSPLSLAASLYQCHTNCSHHINNGWAFSEQTLYVYTHTHIHTVVPWYSSLICSNEWQASNNWWSVFSCRAESWFIQVLASATKWQASAECWNIFSLQNAVSTRFDELWSQWVMRYHCMCVCVYVYIHMHIWYNLISGEILECRQYP